MRSHRTIADWERTRRTVRGFVQAELVAFDPHLRLTGLDEEAFGIVDRWRDRRYPHWDWRSLARSETRRRIEAAAWSSRTLCGLMLGRITSSHVEIVRVEGSPEAAHPLKGRIVDVAIACAEAMAAELGMDEVRIDSPDLALLSFYAARGYTIVVRRGYEIDYVAKRFGDWT